MVGELSKTLLTEHLFCFSEAKAPRVTSENTEKKWERWETGKGLVPLSLHSFWRGFAEHC